MTDQTALRTVSLKMVAKRIAQEKNPEWGWRKPPDPAKVYDVVAHPHMRSLTTYLENMRDNLEDYGFESKEDMQGDIEWNLNEDTCESCGWPKEMAKEAREAGWNEHSLDHLWE